MSHIKKKILPFVFVSGLLASSLAQSAQLGKLEILSGAGEPFRAQIQIDLITPEERASLQARLAPAEAFKAARLAMDPNLEKLEFVVQDGKQPGSAVVQITAAKPLPAGFIDALVELTWAGGRVAREYTLTIPVGAAPEEKPASLPEIRPPMTAPELSSDSTPPGKTPVKSGPVVTDDAGTNNILKIRKGDTLSELAMELVGDGVTLNQAMAALYEANKGAFINGSVHLLREGAQIQVPNRAALRSRSANEALLILARNDDRNVYSAYARQIGLLKVEPQSGTEPSRSAQGTIEPKAQPGNSQATAEDKLQIAPGSASATGNSDANAEELLAKNKALNEANERIALLEKNVNDLQRLLDMQQDLGGSPATQPGDQSGALSNGTGTEEKSPAGEGETPGINVPSDSLAEPSAPSGEVVPAPPTEATPPAASTEEPSSEPAFNWMPWILGGVGGLAILVVLLLIARARRKQNTDQDPVQEAEDEASFSQVHDFDEAIALAGTATDTDRNAGLNQSENSEFDLDEVLNERVAPVVPEPATESPDPVATATDEIRSAENEPDNIPDLSAPSVEAQQQNDSLESDVRLDFPEDETDKAGANPILEDLDALEKGTAAAQEELEALRNRSAGETTPDEDSGFDETDQDEQAEGGAGNDTPLPPLPELETVDLDLNVAEPGVDDATWQEVATKLDLAGAYVEIGDSDGARELLNEIVKKGDAEQVRKAKALLATLT